MIRSARRTARESRWLKVLGTLNEYQARLFVADKALDQGRGGISHLSELTGMSRTTITKAVAELNSRKKLAAAEWGRIREAGGGRKKVEDADPGLQGQLDECSLIIYTMKVSSILYFHRKTTGSALISWKY